MRRRRGHTGPALPLSPSQLNGTLQGGGGGGDGGGRCGGRGQKLIGITDNVK